MSFQVHEIHNIHRFLRDRFLCDIGCGSCDMYNRLRPPPPPQKKKRGEIGTNIQHLLKV